MKKHFNALKTTHCVLSVLSLLLGLAAAILLLCFTWGWKPREDYDPGRIGFYCYFFEIFTLNAFSATERILAAFALAALLIGIVLLIINVFVAMKNVSRKTRRIICFVAAGFFALGEIMFVLCGVRILCLVPGIVVLVDGLVPNSKEGNELVS